VARIVGERLANDLGQALIVENRPGVGGTIGLHAVAKAGADGYTLGVIGLAYLGIPRPSGGMPYDTERDLLPVAQLSWNYNLFAVPGSSPARTVPEFVSRAKGRPGTLKFASGGNGTPAHLAGELFKRSVGLELVHVPYKGAPAGVAALLNGDVDMMIGATGALLPQIKAGKVRALATTAPHRIRAFPDLPTLVDSGYPELVIASWQGIVAPIGTPHAVVHRLHQQITRIMTIHEVTQRLAAIGMEPAHGTPEQFGAHIRNELRKWAQVASDAGIRAD
jgi:tripartite-type tricarboxylate transporter receptor subunit TctC